MPEQIVIADTSCLIILAKIDALGLLQKVYGRVLVTEEIAGEFGEALPEWVQVRRVKTSGNKQRLIRDLDAGEASAIALALQDETGSLLILDDLKARRIAEQKGLRITGTLGVLIRAKKRGHVAAIMPLINKMQQANFRIADQVIRRVQEEAGE